MTLRFDPNLGPFMQGEFTGPVVVTEQPDIGFGNLVIEADKPFDIAAEWKTFGQLNPVWLTALGVTSPNWVVTAYAEPVGPGTPVQLGVVNVPVNAAAPFGLDSTYKAKLTVPANTLAEENPGNASESGVYRIVLTVFLNSTLGGSGYDIIGYAEGPMVKAEDSA